MAFQNEFAKYEWSTLTFNSSIGLTQIKQNVPKKYGVYIVRASQPINRVQGSSNVIYIGLAGAFSRRGTQGIQDRLFASGGANKNWEHNAIQKLFPNQTFTLNYHLTDPTVNPKIIETALLKEYRNEHLELPPGNAQLRD